MCQKCNSNEEVQVTRRKTIKQMLLGSLALFLPLSFLTTSREAKAGYGSCSKCYCQEFEGYSNQCENCGHNYYDHY